MCFCEISFFMLSPSDTVSEGIMFLACPSAVFIRLSGQILLL